MIKFDQTETRIIDMLKKDIEDSIKDSMKRKEKINCNPFIVVSNYTKIIGIGEELFEEKIKYLEELSIIEKYRELFEKSHITKSTRSIRFGNSYSSLRKQGQSYYLHL